LPHTVYCLLIRQFLVLGGSYHVFLFYPTILFVFTPLASAVITKNVTDHLSHTPSLYQALSKSVQFLRRYIKKCLLGSLKYWHDNETALDSGGRQIFSTVKHTRVMRQISLTSNCNTAKLILKNVDNLTIMANIVERHSGNRP